MSKRIKTSYPGVFYREVKRVGGSGTEKVYYIVFKEKGKVVEEKAGRQYLDDMTPARASRIRGERMEGKRESRKEIRDRLEAERLAAQGKWTVTRLWEEYKGQRPLTKAVSTDNSRFELYLKKELGNKEPKEIITLDVDRIRVRLLKQKSPQTVKHVLALLKRIIRFGVKKGLCAAPDPQKLHIEMPKVDNRVTEDLTEEQLVRLLKAIDEDRNQKVASLMKMALYTGMRRGELFSLKWEDVDFERRFIWIRDPKGGQSQSIYLGENAGAVLESQPKTDSPYVFPGRDGGPLKNIQPMLHRIREKAKLPETFRPLHGLRHVYASMLASSGKVDMYTLQKLLTHKSPQMTQRYAHLRDEALKKAAGTADELFSAMNR